MGIFERNVVLSTRIGFIIYPQLAPRIDAPRHVDATGQRYLAESKMA